jgi:hypothetical protein
MEDEYKEDEELTPSSTPPSDVEIPVDSIYGANTPIPLETQQDSNTQNQQGTQQETQQEALAEKPAASNVIRIGLLPLLATVLLLIAVPTLLLIFFGEKKRETDQNSNLSLKPHTENPNETKQKTGFIADQGIYRRSNTLDARELAKNRIGLAKTRIIWVTSNPDSDTILPLLASKKNQIPLPIFILTGKETREEQINNSASYNIPVSQLNIEFETPYSFLIIDDKLLVDISRSHWLWETTEKKIVDETKKWIQNLIEIQKTNDPYKPMTPTNQ